MDAAELPKDVVQAFAKELVVATGGDEGCAKEAFENVAEIASQEKRSCILELEREYYQKSMNLDLSVTGIGATVNIFTFPFAFAPITDAMAKGSNVENVATAIALAVGPTVVGLGIDWFRDFTKQISLRMEYAKRRIALASEQRAEG